LKARVEIEKVFSFFLLLKNFSICAEDLRGEMMVPAAKKLEDLIHLAELCVDLLQQNEEHYAEVSRKPLTPSNPSLTVV
jgi:hypothetical protein